MCEVTFSLTTHFPHSVPGRKKKGGGHKDLDVCYKVASENECLITDIHKPEQPLSKIELRQRKLETMQEEKEPKVHRRNPGWEMAKGQSHHKSK